jgi:hypothetical protein
VVVTPAVTLTVALLAPAATVTEPATVSSPLLLLRFTPKPPLGAALVKLTVQVACADGSTLPGQASEDNCAGAATVSEEVRETPLIEAVTTAVVSVVTEAVLAVNVAPADPAGTSTEAGTVRLALLLESPTLMAVEAALLRFTVQETAAPEATLDGQVTEDNEAGAVTVRLNVREVPLIEAVRTAVVSVVTAAALAVKGALAAPPATTIEPGTVTLPLLLESVTLMPPTDAGRLRVTVQDEAPGPSTEAGLQLTPLSWGSAATRTVPVTVTPPAVAVTVAV